MSLKTLQSIIDFLQEVGVKRVELFANDPLLHPQILQFIKLLNLSGLKYGILTVGGNPNNTEVERIFQESLTAIDPEKGSFVFSVDYSEETARRIVLEGRKNPTYPYAFKALTFWQYADILLENFPLRVNVVITHHNIHEVEGIIRRVIEMNFAASFCFVQMIQPKFIELLNQGLTPALEEYFRKYLFDSRLLSQQEIERIIGNTRKIIANRELADGQIFNTFRGDSSGDEDTIPYDDLQKLREALLSMKRMPGWGENILPSERFINELGNIPNGCLELLKQGCHPQLKIWSNGNIKFCCDLTVPSWQFNVSTLSSSNQMEELSEAVRTDEHIWVCCAFNPCAFSVNYVQYSAKA
ncbi:MAG: hypothetical protein PHW31_01510 [Candidatus Pacebacteria bacterium]|nr:hypothetical protein [Candidatus Paceibacterota bacterium]